jgi:hypothetical protein
MNLQTTWTVSIWVAELRDKPSKHMPCRLFNRYTANANAYRNFSPRLVNRLQYDQLTTENYQRSLW